MLIETSFWRAAKPRIRLALGFALCLLLSACGDDKPEPAENPWHIVSQELDGALFSVGGVDAEHVWLAGADQGNERGPTLLHYDGMGWQAYDPGTTSGDLYWVHVFEGGPVYAAGTGGVVLRVSDGIVEKEPTPSERDVWGVWGISPDDIWAVGGDPNLGTGFVWRNQGSGFEPVELPNEVPTPSAWYKVWGTAANDVWFCGVDGALMHFDGEMLSAVDSGSTRPLLTIHGRADGSLVTAVGGQFSATLVASQDGSAFEDVTPEGPPLQTFGIYHRAEQAYSVGMQGTVLRYDDGRWSEEFTKLDVFEDFHAVWIDPDGGVWAVGGQLISPPFRRGTLIYRGDAPPPAIEY